jgi:putative holliday junction resolvase
VTDTRFRVLAVDYGTKRIGLAISDELRMLASGRGTIPQDPLAVRAIVQLVKANAVREVIVGLPLTLQGHDSEMTTKVRRFSDALSKALDADGVTVTLADERFTSILANSNIAQSGLPKFKREQKELRDEEAARILLQTYLDKLGAAK